MTKRDKLERRQARLERMGCTDTTGSVDCEGGGDIEQVQRTMNASKIKLDRKKNAHGQWRPVLHVLAPDGRMGGFRDISVVVPDDTESRHGRR